MPIVFWDIDGTLLATQAAGRAAMTAGLSDAFGIPKPSSDVKFAGRTDYAIATDFFARHDISLTAANYQRFYDAYLARLPEALDARGSHALPGIKGLLSTLESRPEVAMGLLTGNILEGARLKLAHAGIEFAFPFGGFGADHGDRNDVARAALRDAGRVLNRVIAPAECWVIGDTPNDIACAQAIGAHSIGVCTGIHGKADLEDCRADLVCVDLSDPSHLLSAMGLGNERRHLLFSGRVQGVGFRRRVWQIAHDLPLTGYVKNLTDGRVELVAEGSTLALNQFEAAINQTFANNILAIERLSETPSGIFTDFSIQR